ncbi:MAG TPA: glycosyltransferase family 39 protein [Blastocatellia bacterium]|nr:glycosyltransferase family 39 protein [Blastocatellia bacterium]
MTIQTSTTGISLAAEVAATRDNNVLSRGRTVGFFALLAGVTFLLRIFYSGHLCQDDGYWFTVAEEILSGKALYGEVYFDKPPGLPLVYALLFRIFGAHIVVIRLFAVFYSVAISAVVYLFGRRLYDKRAGLIAAAMFTFFSTTSVNNHQQGLNTDFLMVLPYTASAYLFTRACFERRGLLALIGGVLTGLAVQINPKGVFSLIFLTLLLIATNRWFSGRKTRFSDNDAIPISIDSTDDVETHRATGELSRAGNSALSFLALALIGCVAGVLPFLIYLGARHSLSAYWLYVWDWGSRYSGYYSVLDRVVPGLWLTVKYFARNNMLLFGLIFVAFVATRRSVAELYASRAPRAAGLRRLMSEAQIGVDQRHGVSAYFVHASDVTLLIWFSVSFAGLAVGGRFFSNYFFQILPSLCLIGGRGLLGIKSALKSSRPLVRKVAVAVIAAGFITTVVRFHTRTVQLANSWMRGKISTAVGDWHHEKLNREERMVAAVVRDLPEAAGIGSWREAEAMRASSPRQRGASGSSDYLFVWGSRAEIYYWSGLLPASRYLSTQPLTGVPADVHHDGKSPSILDNSATSLTRIQLVEELGQTRPKYIVDELGFFNPEFSIQSYPELREFMRGYRRIGATGQFLIYRKKSRVKEGS